VTSNRRGRGERGASMVEFALILPVFLILIFGGITASMAYQDRSAVVNAVREGSRFGATLPYAQCDTTSNCTAGGRPHNWATLVQYATQKRSEGALSTSQICVALVTGSSGAIYTRTPTAGVYTTGTTSAFPTTGCFDDGNAYTEARVHVSAIKDGEKINLVFHTFSLSLTSKSVTRYESG
jgi:Flp pilus assembly protein TadG